MRKSLLSTIAGVALFLGGGGLAAAQQMGSPGPTNPGAQGSSQRQPGTIENPSERHPGAMQGQAQGQSGTFAEKERRPGHPGAMQGQAQGRPGTFAEKERRPGHPGAMQGQAQGRSGAVQGRAQEWSGRSVGSTTLTSGQKTRLHEVIAGGNVQRVNHVDFALSVGTRVPNTVRLYDVPNTIVDILPQYRGFEYIFVRHELVIIDPVTLEIVAVLPV